MATDEIAWAAGLFEGEGCFVYQRPNTVVAALSMTDFDVVERFHTIVGVGSVYPRKPTTRGWLPQLRWTVSSRRNVEHILELFRPWLGTRRLARAEEVLRMQAEATAASELHRSLFCKNGHRRTTQNTSYPLSSKGKPYRHCLTCEHEWRRKRRQELKAATISV